METLHVALGDTFDIVLEGTPTSGYVWELANSGEFSRVVQFIGAEWDRVTGEVAGAPARQRFRFRSLVPGSVGLLFKYRRPWEATTRETKEYTISVV
jgi:predicted secreted protein